MTACVVHNLELVEVQKYDGMRSLMLSEPFQHLFEPRFKLTPIGDVRQFVMRRLPGEALDKPLFAGHVMKDENRSARPVLIAGARADQRHRDRRARQSGSGDQVSPRHRCCRRS